MGLGPGVLVKIAIILLMMLVFVIMFVVIVKIQCSYVIRSLILAVSDVYIVTT